MNNVQLFTTPIIDGKPIEKYFGIVTANQVAGTGLFTDLTASFSDLFGGNSGAYRESMNNLCRDVTERLKDKAFELGANAIVGVSIDYDSISAKSMSMFMVSIQGTAVRIANNETDVHISQENEITWDELNLAYHKKKVNRKIESDEPISNTEWEFLIKNDVKSLTPSLYAYFQKCKKVPKSETSNSSGMYVEPQAPAWATSGINNFKKYLSKLDYEDALDYVYDNVEDFSEIISNNKLFSAAHILNLAKDGKLSLAIELLKVEKSSYNVNDLAEMQVLASYLQNLPNVGKQEETKGGFFSSGGMKFICECGTINDISNEFCASCGKNIKGITRSEQLAISEFSELVETLSEVLK